MISERRPNEYHYADRPIPDMNTENSEALLESSFKEYNGEPYRKAMTVRELLQKLGTDAIRDNLHEDAWVNALISEYNRSMEFKKVCSTCNTESTLPICMSCKTNTTKTRIINY